MDDTALKKLVKDMEIDLYHGGPNAFAKQKLCNLLGKLGIRSARGYSDLRFSAPLQVESLDSVLKQVTFDMKDLRLWSKLP